MKRNFLRLCLMMGLLSLDSCRQDLTPEKENYNNSSTFQLTSRKISLNEAKHKNKLVSEIEQVETIFNFFSKNNANCKVVNYENGVSIDTDNVTYIENGPNYHTYTFNLIRDNALPTDPVENLVLTPLTDGTYKELLISYNLTAQEKITLMKGGFVDTKGKITITELADGTYAPLSKGMTSCGWQEDYTFVTECSEHQHGMQNTESWGECSASVKPGWHTTMVYRCNFINDDNNLGGGSTFPSNPPSDGGGSQTPGGGTTPQPCNGNGVATNPTDPNTNIGAGGCSGVVTTPTLPARPIINLDTGLDPKIKCLLQKMAGDTNLTDEKITLSGNSTTDDLFQKMLRKFNGVDAPELTFKYNPTLTATSGAYARGTSLDGGVTYQITVGEGLVQSSNIRIMSTLAHELTHVFMLNELFQLHMIEWMPNGQPKIPNNIVDICTTNHEFSGDSEHFFAELLCYYIDHPSPQLTPQKQMFHDFFGILDNNFKTEAYVQKLAEYVKNNYDWNSESAGWTSVMQTHYGSEWKAEVAMDLQMDAIRQTYYFSTWSPTQSFSDFHGELKKIVDQGQLPNTSTSFPANKNCN